MPTSSSSSRSAPICNPGPGVRDPQEKSITGSFSRRFQWSDVLKNLALTGILILMTAGQAGGGIAERHRYRQISGTTSFQYIWERERRDPAVIRVIEPDDTFITLCDASGETLEWTFSNRKTRVTAKRNGESVRIVGTFRDQPFEAQFPTEGNRWYQALSYALRQLALSEKDASVFWMIRPDTLEPLKLKAVRLEPERIAVSGKMVPAHKLRITLTGLLENLWSAHYWFRRSDGVFLQYKGANGPPGTPETLIYLVD